MMRTIVSVVIMLTMMIMNNDNEVNSKNDHSILFLFFPFF